MPEEKIYSQQIYFKDGYWWTDKPGCRHDTTLLEQLIIKEEIKMDKPRLVYNLDKIVDTIMGLIMFLAIAVGIIFLVLGILRHDVYYLIGGLVMSLLPIIIIKAVEVINNY